MKYGKAGYSIGRAGQSNVGFSIAKAEYGIANVLPSTVLYSKGNADHSTARKANGGQPCRGRLSKGGNMSEREEQRAITLTLIDEKPISWNKMYAGLHWSKRKAEADRVHLAVRAVLDPACDTFENPVEITVRAYFKNQREQLDASNIAAKIYEDGLIGWLIKDDTPEYVRSMTTVSLLDRDNPRVEIEIKEIT